MVMWTGTKEGKVVISERGSKRRLRGGGRRSYSAMLD